jgi:nicotinamidase/pyrazinamidase
MPGRVLLIVDMLNDFIRENGSLYCGPSAARIIENVAAVAKEFADNNEPIIFIMDAHEPDDLEFTRFPRHCVKGSSGADIINELASVAVHGKNVEKVTKNRYSGFFKTNLEELLQRFNPDEIHVVGVCTNICVLYTVEELCNRDYKVIVHRDGVASFDDQAHDWALKQMETVLGAIIV